MLVHCLLRTFAKMQYDFRRVEHNSKNEFVITENLLRHGRKIISFLMRLFVIRVKLAIVICISGRIVRYYCCECVFILCTRMHANVSHYSRRFTFFQFIFKF